MRLLLPQHTNPGPKHYLGDHASNQLNRPLTPKTMPPTGDENGKLKT